MDKFFNLMYDFFSFALPGACIILSILLLPQVNNLLTNDLKLSLTTSSWQTFLVLALAGYIVGYVITPIARQLLLLFIATYLFGLFLPWCTYKFSKKNAVTEENWEFKKKQHGAFVSRLKEKKQSLKFTRIRELAPRNAQYIEFWDMHSKMSHNLAFACIIFMGVLLSNWSLFGDLQMVIFLIAFISFLVLLYLSFDYSLWWSKDLGESFKLTHYKDFIRHFRE